MSEFSRTLLAFRLGIGGVVALLIATFTLLSVGTVASAEPAQQAAATATTPAPAPTATVQPCVSTAQGVQIVLGNPQPGDTLLTGVPVNMAGIAFDPASTSASGIASVTVYLGDRDAGGISLGVALLGQPNPTATAGSQFATAGFTLRTPSLPAGKGGRTIFVYARSSITNTEAILQVPVFLNTAPTPVKGGVPTAVLPPPPACTPTPVPTAIPTATSVPAAAPVSQPLATVGVLQTATPFPTLALPASGGAAPASAAAAPAPAAPAAAAAPAPAAAAVPAAAQTTAPRGGGVPLEVGLGLLTAGALIAGGGVALRRRQSRSATKGGNAASAV